MPQLRFYLFGPPRLEREGRAIKISLRKALALLAYLAVTQQSHSRDALATLFWPEDSQRTARGNLRRALSRLNKALGKGWLEIDRENAGLDPGAGLWLDIDQFQHRLAQCQAHGHASTEVCPDCLPALTEAAELYAGDFLAGFNLPDCPDFDEWQFFQSEGLRQALASALERLVRGHSDRGAYDQALPYARRWLALDPLHESAHRQLMELYARTRQLAAAIRQYEECRRVLEEELGILPSAETTAIYEAIKAKQFPPPEADKHHSQEAGAQRGRGAGEKLPLHNLPPQPTPFIGREEELAEITRRLTDPDCRLLTLVGPGGIGKTRLAIEVAERSLPDGAFPGGINFVPLAALSSSDFLVSVLADILDVSFQGDEAPQGQLLNFLAEIKQAMLLVLDNFEQLVKGADLLLAILQRAPAVKLLVTSRERLNLREEWLLDVRGLPFPETNKDQISKVFETFEVSQGNYSAVQLFEQHARQVQAEFDLTADYPAVIRICQLVEGMPLGLELAAVWVRVLSCQEIAQEIEKNLEFLTTSLRDVPARHHSLIAVFNYSWNHLSPEQQAVFRSLAVFRGGFSREAAEQVAGASLPLLAVLVDKSMLRRNDSGRYELHELLRQYAAEKSDEAGETDQVRDLHLAFFLELAEEAEPKLRGAEQVSWLERLDTETGNLRAALTWTLEGGAAETGLRLVGRLGQFWHMRGHLFSEGIEWLEKVLSRTRAPEQMALQAKAFRWLGRLTYLKGDDAEARSAYDKSLALYRELGDKEGIADALFSLGNIVGIQGDEVAARSFYAEARSFCEESLAILREGDDKWKMAASLNILGEMARVTGDYTAARSFYEESLVIRRTLADQRGTAISLINLGFVANYQGDYRQAATSFERSLALFQKHGGIRGIVDCVAGLGGVAGGIKQPERAARLLGAAQALREALHFRLEYADRIEYDRDVAAVREQLDEATFAAAWAEGRKLTIEQAVQEALAVAVFVKTSTLSRPVPRPPPNLPPQPTPFIGREAELAALDDLIANPEVRLITIVGPGGIGKTRLALALAERQLETGRFPNGIYLVNLAPLTSAEHIVPTMAEALNFPLDSGEQQTRTPQQQILDYLHQKQMLMVIDNFEHLPDGVELIADILQTAPKIQILATSRERLSLHEEQLYPIQGLKFPNWETAADAIRSGDTVEYAAVKLFLQSARRVQPDFELAAADLTDLIRICRLVEGMPLGIELAAAWVDLLSLTDIAAEIQKNLDFLTTEVRNLPERHRSIRAVFDASWQQMNEAEREVFPQLSVFRGGFTRQAAQDVTGASLPLLGTLASKSLLQYNKAHDRYQIHELLRQYGADKLAEQTSAVRDRHSAYYCAGLKQREVDLKGARQQAVLVEIEADIENVRAAWDWAVTHEHVERLGQALDSLAYFYEWRGRFQEGEAACRLAAEKLAAMEPGSEQRLLLARAMAWQGVFSQFLGQPEFASQLFMKALEMVDDPGLANQDTQLERAFILLARGVTAVEVGDRQEARHLLEESRALYQELDDRWGMARVLQEFSTVTWHLGAYDEARQFAEESLALRQRLGDRRGLAKSLGRLGMIVMYQGQIEASQQFLRKAIALYRELGDLESVATATGNFGVTYELSGEFAQARKLSEQAVAIYRNMGVRHSGLTHYLNKVGHATVNLGSYKEAKPHVQAGLTLARELDDQRNTALALLISGQILLAEAEYVEAQQRLEESVIIYRAIGQQGELIGALSILSLAAHGLGHISAAEQQLCEALRKAAVFDVVVQWLEFVLPVSAYLLASQGERGQAVKLYALASRYPYIAKSRWFEDVVGRHITAAAAALPPEIVEAAKAQGRTLDFWETIAEVLEGLSKPD